MTSYVTPKINTEFIFYASVASVGTDNVFQANPTIAAGDFKVSTDGGALGNLTTLPAVTPASGKMIKFTVSATEMNGDNITIVGSDAAGDEWKDIVIGIQTSARQIDDLAYPATTGRSLNISATGVADADMVAISTDATAANNAESFFDGTGYAGTNNVIPTVTDVTNQVSADVTAISGDTTAANNLELQYDTTGLAGDTFPANQAQLGAITNVSSAVNKPAESYTLTTGTQSANTFAATEALDGINHEHTDTAGAMDLYYEFNLGSGSPSSVNVTGYLNGSNDSLEVHGYDWVSSSWKQIGTLVGKALSTNEVNNYALFVNMIGNGANLGLVRIRFTDGAFTLTTATLAIDQIFVTFSLGASGYENGSIWVNTNASNTNTVPGVDGVVGNPVSTWAAALTLSAALNITDFHIINGSTITLSANSDNYSIFGDSWTLALGGQSTASAFFRGASVSGIQTGAGAEFESCSIGSITIANNASLHDCGITGTITVGAAGDFFFHDCYSGVAGTGTPVFDFGAAIGNTNLNIRNYSGGIQLENMGGAGTDTASIEGNGQVIEGTCTAGTVAIRGNFTVSGITNLTLSDDARYDETSVVDATWDELLTGSSHNITNSAGKRLRTAVETGLYEGGQIWIDTVNGTAGDTTYENGTVDIPVDNITDAMTLSAALGINRFKIATGSSITLAATTSNYVFDGIAWALALGGQDVSDSNFADADVSGICTGTIPHFHDCRMDGVTIPPSNIYSCGFTGDMVAGSAGDFAFVDCYSQIAGTATPSFDFGAAIGTTNLSMRHYSGGMEIKNMGGAGTDSMSLEGDGQLVINANCSAGTVAIRGNFTVTDNASGALTLSDDARMDIGQVNAQVVDGLNVDTYAEPGQGTPGATLSLAAKINYIYKAWRNKSTQTGTEYKLYNDDAATVDQKATTSDDGSTFTKTEVESGP